MRWESLFIDLEAQLAGEERRNRTSEIQDMIRVQRSRIRLVDRLEGHVGQSLILRLINSDQERGELRIVGENWISVRQGRNELVVPLGSVSAISELSPRAHLETDPANPRRRISFGSAMRAIARDRSAVVARLRSSPTDRLEVSGTLAAPGKDFLEILEHPRDEFSRHGAVSGVLVMPWESLVSLRRDAQD